MYGVVHNIVSNEKGILHVLNILEGSLHVLLQHLVTFLFSTQFVCKTRGRHTRRLKFKKKNQVNIILSKNIFGLLSLKKNYYYYFLFFKKKFKTNNYTFESVHFLLQFLHGSFSKFSTGLGLKYSKFDVKYK